MCGYNIRSHILLCKKLNMETFDVVVAAAATAAVVVGGGDYFKASSTTVLVEVF